jgi:transmembrane protein EpsG
MMYALVGVVLALGWIGTTAKTKNENSDYYLAFAGLVLLLFMGLRGDFTTDYGNYVELFQEYYNQTLKQIVTTKRELLFALLNKAIGLFSQHFQVLHFAMSALLCVPAVLAIKRSSKNYLLSVFFLYALTYYAQSFNITRNCIAMSFLVFGYQYLTEKKIIRWTLCVIVATGFHTSAILLLPLGLVYFFPVTWKRVLALSVLVLVAVIGYEYILDFMRDVLGFYPNYTDDDSMMRVQQWSEISKTQLLVRSSIYITYFGLLVKKKQLVDEGLYVAIISLGAYLLQFRVYLIYRYDLYLFGFFILLFPNTFERFGFPKAVKIAFSAAIVCLSIIWVSSSYEGEYYPFWQNVVVGQPI